MGQSLDRLEAHFSSFSPSVDPRLRQAIESFPRLLYDVRRMNANLAAYFPLPSPHSSPSLQFHVFSRYSQSRLRSDPSDLWRHANTVILVANSGGMEENPYYWMNIQEFYSIYLYFNDHLEQVQAATKRLKGMRKQGQGQGQGKGEGEEQGGRGTEEEEKDECCVCLNSSIEVVLPCHHAFCSEDLDSWLARDRSCPICRAHVAPGHDDEWNIVEMKEEELEEQIHAATIFIQQFIRKRPSFIRPKEDINNNNNNNNLSASAPAASASIKSDSTIPSEGVRSRQSEEEANAEAAAEVATAEANGTQAGGEGPIDCPLRT